MDGNHAVNQDVAVRDLDVAQLYQVLTFARSIASARGILPGEELSLGPQRKP